MKLRLSLSVLALLLSSLTAQDAPELKTTALTENILVISGGGGNSAALNAVDDILVIDVMVKRAAQVYRELLASQWPGDIAYVINTHYHGDHTGGNTLFGEEATIIAHTNVLKRLSTEQGSGDRIVPPLAAVGQPVITFDETLAINLNGVRLELKHYPHSHTDGDITVLFTKANIVHLGDLCFGLNFPYVDLGSGGDVFGLVETYAKLIKDLPPDVTVIPGHGPISDMDDLKAIQKMLLATTKIVKKNKDKGWDLERIQKKGLGKKWDSWGTGFINADRWIETIYNSLNRK